MIINILFLILMILMVICIAVFSEKEVRPLSVTFSIFLSFFALFMGMDIMEYLIRKNAIKNNAAHWDVKVDPISGNSTKAFKWGPQPVNEPNEQQDNELNEKNK